MIRACGRRSRDRLMNRLHCGHRCRAAVRACCFTTAALHTPRAGVGQPGFAALLAWPRLAAPASSSRGLSRIHTQMPGPVSICRRGWTLTHRRILSGLTTCHFCLRQRGSTRDHCWRCSNNCCRMHRRARLCRGTRRGGCLDLLPDRMWAALFRRASLHYGLDAM